MSYIGNFEENMDLSRIYLAVTEATHFCITADSKQGSYTQIFYCSSIVTNISTKNVFQLLQKQNQTHNFLNFQFWIPNISKICMNLVRLFVSFLLKEKLLNLIRDSKLGIWESKWLSLSQATKMTLTLLILSTLKSLINMLA